MNEFKGTKGKWSVQRLDDTFINSVGQVPVCEIPHNGIYDYTELPYNAQLISKAPELLSTLQDVFDLLENHQPDWYTRGHYRKIRELIKQATEV